MCNEANTFENHDFFSRKITVFEKVSAPFFDPNLHFQKDWTFFSEGVRPSGFFNRKIESGKFMGKLTESKKIVSALRNLEKTIFLVNFCGTVCTHLPKPRAVLIEPTLVLLHIQQFIHQSIILKK